MGALLALLGVLGLLLLIWWRLRGAAGHGRAGGRDPGLDLGDLMREPPDGVDAADSVDDPRLAAAGIIVAVATMDGPISRAEIARLTRAAEETFVISEREALDIVSFGRWIAGQSETNSDAVRALSRAVLRTAGPEAGPDLVRMIAEVATAGGGELGPEERAALATIRQDFGMAPAGRHG